MYGIAVLDDIKDTERIDCEHLHAAVRLVVEHACKVRRNCGDIHLTLYQFCADLIRGSGKFKRIGRGRSAVVITHHFYHSHGGRSL